MVIYTMRCKRKPARKMDELVSPVPVEFQPVYISRRLL